MVRITAIVIALSGCQFVPPPGETPLSDGGGGDSVDGPIDAAVGEPFCSGSGLVACYEFEADARDGGPNALDPTTSNVAFAPGKVGMALVSGDESSLEVANTPLIDVSALTIEAWIQPSQLPNAGERMGIVDVEGQYGFFLHPEGQIQCTAGGGQQIAANIQVGRWTHVACTYDGANRLVYVDGVVISTATGGPLPTNGTMGMTIAANNGPGAASRLIGMVDQLRLWSRALTGNEICRSAATCK